MYNFKFKIYFKLIIVFFLIISVYFGKEYYFNHIDYYAQILKFSKVPDYTRWILTDKYVSKKYAESLGFSIPKTYQLVKYPQEINNRFFKNNYNFVVKPTDLCDSSGVYLIKSGYDVKNKNKINKNDLVLNLLKLRSNIGTEYYMQEYMYNGLIPYSGYIVEELLLDENQNIPYDYKCYVFGGKLYYIAVTYNRKIVNGKQKFNSVWFNANWKPIRHKMIKKGYKCKNILKPKQFLRMKYLVEKFSRSIARHCRVDVYLINDKVYFGEFTFFCGAKLHTLYSNYKLGMLWLKHKDNFNYQNQNEIVKIKNLTPNFYNIIPNLK